jgi:DNA polymerase-3 subunit alpha
MIATGQNDLFGLSAPEESTVEIEPADYWRDVQAWSEKDRLEFEKQTLGLYLTGHPIAEYVDELKYMVNGSLNDLAADAERAKGKMEGRVAGFVVDIRTRQSKQGKTMAFAVLDDRTARLEVAAFSNTYEKYRTLLIKDSILIAEGSVSFDDYSGNLRMTADKVMSMEEAREQFARAILLKWSPDSQETQTAFIEHLTHCLGPYRGGQCPILIDYLVEGAKASIQLGEDWRVHPTDELILKLRRWLTKDAVQIKYRN